MKQVGIGLSVLGVVMIVIGFGMQTTAGYSSTLNMGLLNDQANMIMAGGFAAVSGTMLYVASQILEAIGTLRVTDPEPAASSPPEE